MLLIGIIQIEINKSQNTDVKVKLRDIEQRIYNISVIHKYIYNHNSYKSLNADYILNEVIENLKENLDHNLSKKIYLSTQNINLHISKVLPMILIINELINNSIKYALKKSDDYIKINLEKNNEKIEFSVTDSGKGFDVNRLNSSQESVGLFIIKILVKQLKGEVFYDFSDGEFKILIKFNCDDDKKNFNSGR